jgi:peptide/nickel transport system substrate-binding protein
LTPISPSIKRCKRSSAACSSGGLWAHAIDKESIIENIYNGLAIPQWSPVSIPSPYYDKSESFTKYEYSLQRAAQLLDEIGLKDIDGDGVRNITDEFLKNFADPEDRPTDLTPFGPEKDRELEFTLATNSGNQIREKIVSLLVNDFAKIGVKANARPVDFNALVNQLTTSTFEAMVLGLTGSPEPNNGSNVWKTNGRLHFWRYSSKEKPPAWEKRVDELFDLGATTFDDEEVKRIYKEFQQIVSENLPYIYLVNQQFLYASKAGLGNNENFKPNWGCWPWPTRCGGRTSSGGSKPGFAWTVRRAAGGGTMKALCSTISCVV